MNPGRIGPGELSEEHEDGRIMRIERWRRVFAPSANRVAERMQWHDEGEFHCRLKPHCGKFGFRGCRGRRRAYSKGGLVDIVRLMPIARQTMLVHVR